MGCMVGPDFQRPAAPNVQNFADQPAEMPNQRLAAGQDIPAEWWTLFRSEKLKRLIEKAFARSPDLESAQAALTQAKESLFAQEGSLMPALDISGMGKRLSLNSGMFGDPNGNGGIMMAMYNASLNLSYTIDTFGALRRQLEDLGAQVDYQRFQWEAAYLNLASNIAAAAIGEASLREQIGILQDVAVSQEQSLEILNQQWRLGATTWSAVLSQESALNQARADLVTLRQQLAQTRHRIAMLAGQLPGEALTEEFTLADLQLPEEIPLSLPSKLVEQRPDIRSAEALLHSASAQVGVATAKRFPDLTINASIGSFATKAGMLFTPASEIWSQGFNLAQPLLQWGKLSHGLDAAKAAFAEAQAKYRSTVLQAFQNVADVMKALEADHQVLTVQQNASRIAAENLALSNAQIQAGALSYLNLLDAQRNYQQARVGLAKAQAARLSDSAALLQALGGGWWNRPPDTSDSGDAAAENAER
ncbi:efflux transporter outer membrane subunit [Methylogaea oryzae]|nr:efflux transporter outer membrane subunit [Methylogaea oryzae]